MWLIPSRPLIFVWLRCELPSRPHGRHGPMAQDYPETDETLLYCSPEDLVILYLKKNMAVSSWVLLC